MLLWEYLLRADNELDLSCPDRAKTWFEKQPWIMWNSDANGNRGPDSVDWNMFDRNIWQNNLLAFRSIVARLKPKPKTTKLRHPFPDTESDRFQFDGILQGVLGKMTVVPVKAPSRPANSGDGAAFINEQQIPGQIIQEPPTLISKKEFDECRFFSDKSFAGLRIRPTRATRHGRSLASIPFDRREQDVFWQCVFYSIVAVDTLEPLCSKCGRDLPSTKSGLPSRRKKCRKCTNQQWAERTGKTKIRAMWSEAKKRQRDNQK